MEINQPNNEQKLALKRRREHIVDIVIDTLWRIIGIALTSTAIGLMITSKQTIELMPTFQVMAKYSYSPAFKYFVGASIAAVIISVLSFALLCFYADVPYFAVFISDFMATLLSVSGFAAASAIGYVGQYGNDHTYWSPICEQMGKFCKRVKISLIFSFVGLIISVILTLRSAYTPYKINKVPVSK